MGPYSSAGRALYLWGYFMTMQGSRVRISIWAFFLCSDIIVRRSYFPVFASLRCKFWCSVFNLMRSDGQPQDLLLCYKFDWKKVYIDIFDLPSIFIPRDATDYVHFSQTSCRWRYAFAVSCMIRNIYHSKKVRYDYIFDDAWDHRGWAWEHHHSRRPCVNETIISQNRSVLPQIDHFCFMRHHSCIFPERI